MNFPQYARVIKVVFSEELQRMSEYLSAVDKLDDVSSDGDKYYILSPRSECPPNFEDVKRALEPYDVEVLLRVLERNSYFETAEQTKQREELLLELRDILLEV